MRLIDADDMKKHIDGSNDDGIKTIMEWIDSQPTIKPQRMRGKWIDKGWNGDWQYQTDGRGRSWHEWQCSECNHITKGAKWNFCPNCGVDMGGEQELIIDGYTADAITMMNQQTTGISNSETANQPKMVGWICPVCGRGLSPFTSVCPCKETGKGWEVTC